MFRRIVKLSYTVIVLLLLAGLLLFAHDDYDTMENWDWNYGDDSELSFWQDLLGIDPEDGWEDWDEDGEDWGEEDGEDWEEGDGWGEEDSADWEEEDWGEEDWNEEDWSEEDWSEEDWGEEDWNEEDWGEEDWSEDDWGEEDDWSEDGEEDARKEDGDGAEDNWDPDNPPGDPTVGDEIPEEDEGEDLPTRNTRMLARLIFGEARGVDSKVEQAAVAWCALNRLDAEGLGPEDLGKVVNKSHFGGYDKNDPVYPHHWDLAKSVYEAWLEERATGKLSSLRILPKEYLYYWGTRTHNWFVTDKSYIGSKRKAWSFSSRDPYASARKYHLRHYVPSDEELDMLAQVVHYKARGVESEQERAAVVWCVLNRVQSPLYEDTVKDVLLHENQFSPYDPEMYVRSSIHRLVEDVVDRWHREMQGRTDVGRVLPEEYLYFRGDGEHNYFYTKPNGTLKWDWSNYNPYPD